MNRNQRLTVDTLEDTLGFLREKVVRTCYPLTKDVDLILHLVKQLREEDETD